MIGTQDLLLIQQSVIVSTTFPRAMREALEDGSGWKMEKLSLVRYSGGDYFPEDDYGKR